VGSKISIMVATNDKAKMTIKYTEHKNFNVDVFYSGNLGRTRQVRRLVFICVRMD
jgi:hypothetical protein